ncbi:hypothetical protein L2109_11745 [Citrobacter portucalensis]|nr:hypothetical protein [Citrobacter portucalensis]MDE9661961.1 hypothetical protein [Citrobacter portucalensis]MDE9673983.1 hypothetical protein [Citrobacter portucalensis]
MTALNKQALIAKIKKQTESFDTVVLKEDEANALLDELEAAEKRIAEHNFENRLLANADRDIKALRQRIPEHRCLLSAAPVLCRFYSIPANHLGESYRRL